MSRETASHDHGQKPWELYFAIAAGVTYFAGLLAEFAFKAPGAIWLCLYLATYFFGGFFTTKEALASVRRGSFEVDFLMIVAAVGAAAIGKFGEGAVLLFLFSLGHSLEEYAMSRATKSIKALGDLAPRVATVKRDSGRNEEVPVEELKIGDTVLVRPHSRIPADGFVIEGQTSIDQSAVTGESLPVEKVRVDSEAAILSGTIAIPDESKVFAGTVNGAGTIEICVMAAAADSTLARVVKMVEDADVSGSPTQRFIDKFQLWYVPIVIISVIATLLFGMFVFDESFTDSFYRAMIVLVAASPCALAIATPSAVLAAIGRAASAGVLIKGGMPLEVLGKVDVFAFDKTGTLTWGQPTISEIIPGEGVSVERLREVTFAVESLSSHPLAETIAFELAPANGLGSKLKAHDLVALPGRGVQATMDGQIIRIGNELMMGEAGLDIPDSLRANVKRLQQAGQTIMIIAEGNAFLGVIAVMDRPREESRETLEVLRESGVKQLVMLSGDNQLVAGSVGQAVGVDRAIGGLLPEDKVAKVRDLANGNATIAVVGDGVNDAPAMAVSDVAIAMGAAGSAVALETADIALMSDDLGKIPFARRLSKATTLIVHQNLLIALVIVAILVPASLLGLAIGPVVIIHEGSTLLVVLNALRLLAFDKGKEHHGIVHEDRPERS